MINIKALDLSLLRIDEKSYKNIGIYNIGYNTIKKIDYYKIFVNSLYLMICIGCIKELDVSRK